MDAIDEEDTPALGAPHLAAALEALLIVADEPLTVAQLAAATFSPQPAVSAVLADLAADYTREGRGFDLREAGGGWRFYTREDCAEVVARYVTDGLTARLSQAALETLAVVAYRQPVTRAQVAAIRGVSVDGVLRTLQTRGLVHQVDTDPQTGAGLFGTTRYFLERLGISDLTALPPLAEHIPIGSELADLIADQG